MMKLNEHINRSLASYIAESAPHFLVNRKSQNSACTVKAKDWRDLKNIVKNALSNGTKGITLDLNFIDTGEVTTFMNMFMGYDDLDIDISEWDMSNAKYLRSMFRDTSFAVQPDLSRWNVSNVINFSGMFQGSNFNSDISAWDTHNAIDMTYMFAENEDFKQDISMWDVSNCKTFCGVFNKCPNMIDSDLRPKFKLF